MSRSGGNFPFCEILVVTKTMRLIMNVISGVKIIIFHVFTDCNFLFYKWIIGWSDSARHRKIIFRGIIECIETLSILIPLVYYQLSITLQSCFNCQLMCLIHFLILFYLKFWVF